MARILVIDDDAGVRSFLRDSLRLRGHQVDLASDGDAGLRLFRELPADVVIVDIFMPDRDGIATLLSLLREYPDLKIIAISGGGGEGRFEFLEVARSLGAVGTLRKPFQVTQLLTILDEAIAA
jgi:CheY-like chemotaxis protein